MLAMLPVFEKPIIVGSVILSHFIMTLLTVAIAYVFALFFSQTEGQIVSGIVIYVIIFYEVVWHVLPKATHYLELNDKSLHWNDL